MVTSAIDNERVKIWISLAENDLKCSLILYKKGEHRNSYMLFQQATEKAVKALALKDNISEEDFFLKVKHDPLKIFKKHYNNEIEKTSIAVDELLKNEGADTRKLSKLQKKLNRFRDGLKGLELLAAEDLVNIDEGDIEKVLHEIKASFFLNFKMPKTYGKTAKKHIEQFLEIVNTSNESTTEKNEAKDLFSSDAKAKKVYEFVSNLFNTMQETMVLWYGTMVCAVITVKHGVSTRYPGGGGVNPLSIYLANFPLVRAQPEFMKLLSRALLILKKAPK